MARMFQTMQILLFLLRALADNVEFRKHEFDVIYCMDDIIYAKDLKYANSVKISHLGDIRLEVLEPEPKVLVVYDRTQYFGSPRPMVYRIDYERMILGLASFAWTFIGFCILVGVFFIKVVNLLFAYADYCEKHRAKGEIAADELETEMSCTFACRL